MGGPRGAMPDIGEEEAGEAEAVEAMEVMAVDMDMPDVEDKFTSSVGHRVRFDDPYVLDRGGYCLLTYANNELIMSDG